MEYESNEKKAIAAFIGTMINYSKSSNFAVIECVENITAHFGLIEKDFDNNFDNFYDIILVLKHMNQEKRNDVRNIIKYCQKKISPLSVEFSESLPKVYSILQSES